MPNKNRQKHAAGKPGTIKKRARKKTRGATPPKAAQAAAAPAAVLDSRKLRELYSTMLKCRLLGEKARELAPALAGREAVLVGAVAHAQEGDSTIVASDALLAGFDVIRGEKPGALLAARRSQAGSTAGPAASQGPPGQFALKKAMAQAGEMMVQAGAMKERGKVALVFCGADADAATWQQESLAQAARQKLPLVCMAETSLAQLSTAQPSAADEQPSAALAEQGANHAARANMDSYFPRIVVDGNDVVAVFRVAQEAVRRARGGHGPSLLQCVMPGAAPGPGGKSARDPLAFMERYLRKRKLWSGAWQKKMVEDFRVELERAMRE